METWIYGLDEEIANNPITNNPAITNNDQPSFNRFSIPLLPQPEYPGGEPMAYVNIMLLLISFMLYHAGTAVKDFVEGCVVTLASVIKKNAGGLGTARNIDWGGIDVRRVMIAGILLSISSPKVRQQVKLF